MNGNTKLHIKDPDFVHFRIKKKHLVVAGLLLFFIALLLIPFVMRNIQGHRFPFGYQTFETLNNIKTGNDFNLFYYLTTYLSEKIPLNLLSQILPIIMGFVNFILFYFVLREIFSKIEFKDKKKEIIFILLFFVFSPAILYIFTTFTPYFFILFLSLIIVLLTLKNKFLASSLVLILLALTEFYSFIIMFLFLAGFMLYKDFYKKNPKKFLFLIPSLLISILSLFLFNIKILRFFDINFTITNYFSETGSYMAFPLFLIILFIVGLASNWKRSSYFVLPHLAFFVFIIFSFFSPISRFFINFIFVFYASKGVIFLIKRKWNIKILKSFVFLLIVLSILFSTIFTVSSLVKEEPSLDLEKSLIFLRKYSLKEEKILSIPENDQYIKYIAEREPFFYTKEKYIQPLKFEKFFVVFTSQNIKTTSKIFEEHNIKYVIIDKKTRNEIFPRPKKGLLFLLYYNENFIKINEFNNVEIWGYNPEKKKK